MLHAPDGAGLPVSGGRLGRAPGSLRLPPHEATTASLGAAYPFAASLRLPVDRVVVGRDVAGGAFLHDPFELYRAGAVTNPNLTILGQIGRGKSALVKTYLLRLAAFGRRLAVLDPKGEYGPLAEALGTTPVRLSPSGGSRVNPLEASGETTTGRLALVGALAEATMHRRLSPGERLALEVAVGAAVEVAGELGEPPTLPLVVDQLLRPGLRSRPAGSDASPSTADVLQLRADGRDVGLELRRLVHGDLAGMFDGTTRASVDPAAGVLVVDLSEVYHSEALPVVMVCAAAWLQAMTAGAGSQTVFVLDEAWAVLSDVAVGRYLRASWKLARARGLANIAVCHRASDLASAGAAGSEAARLAEGLLTDSETIVCYAQPASELAALAGLLGCSEEEISYLPTLARGVALWRVGGRRYLVEHFVGSHERALVDTDQRLRPGVPR